MILQAAAGIGRTAKAERAGGGPQINNLRTDVASSGHAVMIGDTIRLPFAVLPGR